MSTPPSVDREQIVASLFHTWSSIQDLIDGLDEHEWDTPTDLPGWDVRDNVAHLVGIEATLAGDPSPEAPPDLATREHVLNDLAASNEAWVVSMRGLPGAEVARRFREVTDRRRHALAAMTDRDFAAPSWTPVGDADYARFMQVRIFDCWMHEQDIRVALDRPGNQDGPGAVDSLAETTRMLGYIVGKRGAAPRGSLVTLRLTGALPRRLHVVVEDRARVVEEPPRDPDVTITTDSSTFMRLAGGRVDAATVGDGVAIEGDTELGSRIVANLGYTI